MKNIVKKKKHQNDVDVDYTMLLWFLSRYMKDGACCKGVAWY